MFICLTSSLLYAQYRVEKAFPLLNFDNPVDFQVTPGDSDRIFIVEQPGRIKVFERSGAPPAAKTFIDLTDSVIFGGERGLLGLAFHPQYSDNGYFYVNYTKPNPLRTVISRFQVSSNPDSADRHSELILLTFNQPYTNHNGGQIVFGPDGYLYIAAGDGGSAGDPNGNGQNLSTYLGKILRIDVNNHNSRRNYSVPADNPFYLLDSAYKEIYAYGLRNPWRFCFDSKGTLWCADVGQNSWEEIDTITSGGNYGWNIMEGNHCYSPSTDCNTTGLNLPVFEYSHSPGGGYSVTGGYVYEGSDLQALRGKYIFADYVSKKIWSLQLSSLSVSSELLAAAPAGITSFGKDTRGELYMCASDGNIYKLTNASTSLDKNEHQPSAYILFQNYPNPFNPATNIKYFVPGESIVTIQLINTSGELVSTLLSGIKPGGEHIIKLSSSDFNIASGVYFVRMNAESSDGHTTFQQTIKLMHLK